MLTNINVTENSLISKFSIGDSITFNTSFDSICGGFRERLIENGSKNIMYEAFNSVKNKKGEWVLKFYEDVVLQKEHTYTLEIEGHEVADSKSKAVGKVSVVYRGNGEKPQDFVDDYEYSNIQYLNFTLKNGGELDNLRRNFIGIEFSGDVSIDIDRSKIIDEDSIEHDFLNIIPYDDNPKRAWQFFIPLELMLKSTSYLTLRIYAVDLAGRAVKGNVEDYVEKGGNNYYELKYRCEFGYPILNVYPEKGRYNALKEFTFSNEDGLEIKNGQNEIQLLSANNEVLRSFPAELTIGEDGFSRVYSLEQPFDSVGYYTLIVPAGTFSLGVKGKDNKETLITYEISNKLKSYGIESVYPEDGSEVESLSKIVITFEDIAMPEYFSQKAITVTDSNSVVVTTAKATIDENRENDRQCIIVLDTPIKDPGFYHLNIPSNTFSLGKWGDGMSEEMTFDYTVTGLTYSIGDVTIQTTCDDEKMLNSIIIDFNKFSRVYVLGISDEKSIDVTLTDKLNNEVAKAHLRLGQFYNQVIVDHIESRLSTGEYLLHIPASILMLDGDIYESELIFNINFDPAYDVDIRTKEDSNHKLESIDLLFQNYDVVDLTGGRNVTYHDVTLTDEDNNVIATAQISLGRQKNNQLTVDNIRTVDELKDELGEKLGGGTYKLHVPAGTMILDRETYDKEYVLAINFDPIVTGAPSGIAQKGADRVRVYSAQGMLTRDVKDPEAALRGLRRGLYIINGKKVLIK